MLARTRKQNHINVLTLIFSLAICTGVAESYQTENVFVVVIDGIRNTEAFGATKPETYIPKIWSLRSEGTSYSNFYNNGVTITASAHSTILTGVWESVPLLPKISQSPSDSNRPKHPTIFEYYRKQLGVPMSKTWLIAGKSPLEKKEHSLHPGYGKPYSAAISPNALGQTDAKVWTEIQRVMRVNHPSLALINLKDVDSAGHKRVWSGYTKAIRIADDIVYRLWNKIQSDPVYRNKTTLILTTDHGRHTDEHGGIGSHGCSCIGCRHLIFLALGPDIKRGVTVSTPHEQIDIAPTVGELLGFGTPLSDGRILWEMLNQTDGSSDTLTGTPGTASDDAYQLSSGSNRAKYPAVGIDEQTGDLHAVWSRDDGNERGWQVCYRNQQNGNWEPEQNISGDSIYAYHPSIAVSDTNVAHVVWYGYSASSGGLQKGIPRIYYWNSNTGITEQLEQATPSFARFPDVAVAPNGLVHVVWSGRDAYVTSDGEDHFEFGYLYHAQRNAAGEWSEPTTVSEHVNPLSPAIAIDISGKLHVTWQYFDEYNWEIYRASRTITAGWSHSVRLTQDTVPAYDPAISAGDNSYLLWVDRRPGHWQLYSPFGRAIVTTAETWTPAVSTIQMLGSAEEHCYAVWSDYRNGRDNPEIYLRNGLSPQSSGLRVSNGTGLSLNPEIALHTTAAGVNQVHVVWQDNVSGNWGIHYLAQSHQPGSGARTSRKAAPISQAKAVSQPSLGPNFPNPFNPETWIPYTLANSTDVQIRIYNPVGQLVRALDLGHREAGVYHSRNAAAHWDGRNDAGERVSSGVYSYTLQAGAYTATRRMIIMK